MMAKRRATITDGFHWGSPLVAARRAGLATLVIAAVCYPSTVRAQTVGAASRFAIVGGTAVSANGAGSLVNGDVGVSPGNAITGFPGSATTVPPFTTHSNDGAAFDAQAAVLTLYNALAAMGAGTPILPQLNAQILGPGTYSTGAADLAAGGTLTLNGAGTYIFKIASTLTSNVGSRVVLQGGADACSVYWQVTSAATLNGVNFAGNVVAQAAVTLGVGDVLAGRALTTSLGSVTLSGTNTAGGCSVPVGVLPPPPPVPVPTDLFVTKTHTGNFVAGTNGTYRIALFNAGTVASSGAITVTDTLPAGLTFVSATGVNSWTCSAAGQVVTCTTSASVLGSFPNPITLTVKPSISAVPTVTNSAVVSGGGDTDVTNNTTVDVTVVEPGVTAVPTLPEGALLALTMLLAVAGFMALRRRTTS